MAMALFCSTMQYAQLFQRGLDHHLLSKYLWDTTIHFMAGSLVVIGACWTDFPPREGV
jgi:hypothetical protein